MCLLFPRAVLLLLLMGASLAAATQLRICADPDNLPFSNRARQGFDDQIAALVAHAIGRQPKFVWARSRRGFLREEFNKNACDVLMGVPQAMRSVETTRAYYRAAYLFVTRRRESLQIASFDDPRLNGRRIGLQVLDSDMSPPSLALIRSGHAGQLVGFPSFGTHEADVVRAVADRRVGAAVVWGPVAGYFATREHLQLTLTPVSPLKDPSGVPFAFSIAMAVHKQDTALRDRLNSALVHLQPRINRVLAAYGVPTLALEEEER